MSGCVDESGAEVELNEDMTTVCPPVCLPARTRRRNRFLLQSSPSARSLLPKKHAKGDDVVSDLFIRSLDPSSLLAFLLPFPFSIFPLPLQSCIEIIFAVLNNTLQRTNLNSLNEHHHHG